MVEMNTFRLALIHVTINVYNRGMHTSFTIMSQLIYWLTFYVYLDQHLAGPYTGCMTPRPRPAKTAAGLEAKPVFCLVSCYHSPCASIWTSGQGIQLDQCWVCKDRLFKWTNQALCYTYLRYASFIYKQYVQCLGCNNTCVYQLKRYTQLLFMFIWTSIWLVHILDVWPLGRGQLRLQLDSRQSQFSVWSAVTTRLVLPYGRVVKEYSLTNVEYAKIDCLNEQIRLYVSLI